METPEHEGWVMSPVEEEPRAPWRALFVRPGEFLRTRARRFSEATVVLMILLMGAAGAVDGIENRILRHGEVPPVLNHWFVYWAIVFFGALFGPVGYVFRGWWYRVRLWACGVRGADVSLARRVNLFTTILVAVPTLVLTAGETIVFATPQAAEDSEVLIQYYVLLCFLPWSCFVSWRASRVVFGAARVRALFLFFLLPSAIYFAAWIGFGFMYEYFQARRSAATDRPKQHEGETFSFRYPGNWWLGDDETDDTPMYVRVDPPQEAWVSLETYESYEPLETEVAGAFDRLREAGFADGDDAVSSMQEWGHLRGAGEVRVMAFDGDEYRISVLVSRPTHGWACEVRELIRVNHVELVAPGVEQLQHGLELTAEWMSPPDLDDARTFDAGPLSFSHPGNWEAWINPRTTVVEPIVHVDTPQDVRIRVLVYRRQRQLEEELDVTVDELRGDAEVTTTSTFDEWAGLNGRGRTGELVDDPAGKRYWMFATHATGKRIVEVHAYYALVDEPIVMQGLELMERDFEMGP